MVGENMISKNELIEYAKLRNLQNLGFAEKDYFQNILLLVIYQNFGNELVFKGGTALSKCYGLNRFSEDLDFSCFKKFDFKVIEESLKRFKIDFEVEKEELERSHTYILRIKGPLFNGNKNSKCKLILDFIFREEILIKPVVKTIGRFLEEFPVFDVYVMSLEEIFAEKVKTILMRDKARDVYDFCFLIDSGVKFNESLVNKKLAYYKISFDKKKFLSSVKNKKEIWSSELSALVSGLYDFKDAFAKIEKFINKEYE